MRRKRQRKKGPPERAIRALRAAVLEVASDPEACARDPARDFTRSRKIPLPLLITTMVTWGRDTIGIELEDVDGWTGGAPTASAFCQQRAKLRGDVMPRVNSELLRACDQAPLMGRFELYGIDGTDVPLCPSSDPRTRIKSNKSGAARNEAHPTTSYDIKRHTFQDMVWQGSKEQNENDAFCLLVDRMPPPVTRDGKRLRPLVTADRNFFSYNSLCHLKEAGCSFILRMQDDQVEKLLGKGNVPEGCFDITVERVFVRSGSLSARTRPDEPGIYKQLSSSTKFDAIGEFNRLAEYPMRLRVVRRMLPRRDGDKNRSGDRWLNLVTDLAGHEFKAKWLVRTYKRRWGHEVGYLHLKKVVGMEDPKTRVFERAEMEVWGRMILYNACALGTNKVLSKRLRGKKLKRRRDLTTAFKGMMFKIRGARVDNLVKACKRHTHTVVGGRHFPRRRRNKSPAKMGHRG